MSSIVSTLQESARKVNNFASDATGGGATGTTYWTDTTHYRATVPTGKRWMVIGGAINRDVSGTVDVRAKDASGNTIYMIDSQAAAATITAYPNKTANAYMTAPASVPWILEAGEYIEATFGVAQGATAYMSCVVLEVTI